MFVSERNERMSDIAAIEIKSQLVCYIDLTPSKQTDQRCDLHNNDIARVSPGDTRVPD